MSTEYDASYTHRQANRSGFRKWVRRLYLARAASQVSGPTLDFGCGIGELLSRLPAGSEGLEYNQATVERCRRAGLPVRWYDGYADDWQLSALPPSARFESMVASHVLEHLDAPLDVFIKLVRSARKRGVRRALAVVPGPAGYRIPRPTGRSWTSTCCHRPASLLKQASGSAGSNTFPSTSDGIGKWFPHHELQVLYEALD